MRPSLSQPYDGPFEVIGRKEKFFKIRIRGREQNINIDRLKAAFMANDEQETAVPATTITTSPHTSNDRETADERPTTTNAKSPERTNIFDRLEGRNLATKATRAGRKVTIPLRYR